MRQFGSDEPGRCWRRMMFNFMVSAKKLSAILIIRTKLGTRGRCHQWAHFELLVVCGSRHGSRWERKMSVSTVESLVQRIGKRTVRCLCTLGDMGSVEIVQGAKSTRRRRRRSDNGLLMRREENLMLSLWCVVSCLFMPRGGHRHRRCWCVSFPPLPFMG